MNTISLETSGLRQAASATIDGAMAQPAGEQAASDQVLTGPALVIANVRAEISKVTTANSRQAMMAMMDSVYQTMKAMVDNLAPSEKEKSNKERRLEELEELRRKLEDEELSLEEAARMFENVAIAAADRALLDANMSEAQPRA